MALSYTFWKYLLAVLVYYVHKNSGDHFFCDNCCMHMYISLRAITTIAGSGLRNPKLSNYGGSPPDSVLTGSSGAQRGSIVSIPSLNKLRRRRSFENLDVELNRVKRFADSSSDEEDDDRERKRSEVSSRKSSRGKFYM